MRHVARWKFEDWPAEDSVDGSIWCADIDIRVEIASFQGSVGHSQALHKGLINW